MKAFILAVSIAKTHLLSKIRQTIVAALGVTFGIAMFIVMISFMTGVNELLEETTLTSTPHIRIYNDIETDRPSILEAVHGGEKRWNIVHHMKAREEQTNLKKGLAVAERIKKESRVTGVSAQLTTQVFYNNGPSQISGTLAGVHIVDEDNLYDLKSKIKSGDMTGLIAGRDVILMGEGLAKKLNVRSGDKVTVTTPQGSTKVLRIAGTFKYGIGAIDNLRSYAGIQTVQKIMGKAPDYISELHIKLSDITQAKSMAKKYEARYGFNAEDWETANATILVSFKIRNILTYVVSATLLIVAGFGIYNIMNMTVYDKMKDIAILKANGFQSKSIIMIFLLQSVFIGVIGGLVGIQLGFTLSYMLSKMPFDGGEFLSIETFPVSMNPKFYIFGLLFGVITTMLAGYFPAKRASKIDPVRILRG